MCYEAAVSRGKTPSIESVDGTDFHVCYLPSVLGAILLAFEQNVYGNYVGFLHRVEKQLQSRWGLEEASGGTYTGAHCRYEPAFHFTKQELAFGPKSEDTETRLKYCRRPYQFCNQISDQSKGFEDRVSSAFPGYSIGRTFRNLMIGYDADFLLRGVSASAWSSLVKVSDRWRDLCRLTCREGVIMPSYSSKGSLKQLLGDEFGQIDNEKEAQLRDWALDALEARFGRITESCGKAVETVQWRFLGEESPMAIVAQTKDEIIKGFQSCLSPFLKEPLIKDSDA